MFIEAVYSALSLDLGWFVEVTLNNLFWVFGFMAAAFYFWDGKKVWGHFFIVVAVMWISLDFTALTGWTFFAAMFLMVLYIGRMAVLMFAETTNFGKKNLPLIYVLYFWIWLVIFNLFFA